IGIAGQGRTVIRPDGMEDAVEKRHSIVIAETKERCLGYRPVGCARADLNVGRECLTPIDADRCKDLSRYIGGTGVPAVIPGNRHVSGNWINGNLRQKLTVPRVVIIDLDRV